MAIEFLLSKENFKKFNKLLPPDFIHIIIHRKV